MDDVIGVGKETRREYGLVRATIHVIHTESEGASGSHENFGNPTHSLSLEKDYVFVCRRFGVIDGSG
jgi:hypothetical protein